MLLTPDIVREIRNSTLSDRELADRFGTGTMNIGAVRKRRTWSWVLDEKPGPGYSVTLDGDEWRFVPGREDYQVSDMGRVRNMKRGGRVLKLQMEDGYPSIKIEKKNISVHRLVMLSFLGEPVGKANCVNHINGDKTDNRLQNLEYVTQQQNTLHSVYVLGNLLGSNLNHDGLVEIRNALPEPSKLESIASEVWESYGVGVEKMLEIWCSEDMVHVIEDLLSRSEKNNVLDSDEEAWLPIAGTSKYIVSDGGRIKNSASGKCLKPMLNHKGYARVNLYFDNETRRKPFVHRLVLEAFNPTNDDGMQCNHLNGVKDDNRLCNLEWTTSRKNCLHAVHVIGRREGVLVSGNQVVEIFRLRSTSIHRKAVQLSKRLKIATSTVYRIWFGLVWNDIPDVLYTSLRDLFENGPPGSPFTHKSLLQRQKMGLV